MAGSIIGLSAPGEMMNFGMGGLVVSISTVLCVFLAIRLHMAEH